MENLQGKVALITGSGSGIGKAGALLFAEAGAKLAVVDINEEVGQAVVKEIKAKGGEAIFIRTDVSQVAQVEAMIQSAAKAFGRLDIFWHNAGNVGPGAVEKTSEKDYDLTMDIHVKGGFFGARFAVEEMKKVGGGAMLFTSSLAGLKPSRQSTVYSIAKAGLIMLTKNLTVHYAPFNVRVNCVCPGAVPTPLWPVFASRDLDKIDHKKAEEVAKAYIEKTPLRRMTTPEDIARAALFLCSDSASYVTGEIMSVDGGLSVL